MKTAFITGATGFIGKNLVKSLLDDNVKVYALVLQEEAAKLPEAENLVPIIGNLNQTEEIESQIGDSRFDVVFHLAWEGVSTTVKNEFDIQTRNIKYAFHVLEIARKHGCKKIIITGSISEYAYRQEIKPEYAPAPSDFYSATKAAVHIYSDLYTRLYGDMALNWTVISSIYGPGRDDNNIISYTIKSLLHNEKTEYTKLEQIWDYVYIDDVIKALKLVALKGKNGMMYQIGSGNARPLLDYILEIKDSINPKAELGIGKVPYKTKQIDNSIVDITSLQEDTGYKAETSFEDGIRQTIAYFKEIER